MKNGHQPRICLIPKLHELGTVQALRRAKSGGTHTKVLAMIQEAGNGTAVKVILTGAEAEVLTLIKQEGGGPKLGTHHNCSKRGRWSRECKEPRKNRGNARIPS